MVISFDGPACVSAVALVARFTEMFGRLSLSFDSDPLFSIRRPVLFRCWFSALALFLARSFICCGFGGAKYALVFFAFGFVATPDFLSTTPLFSVNSVLLFLNGLVMTFLNFGFRFADTMSQRSRLSALSRRFYDRRFIVLISRLLIS